MNKQEFVAQVAENAGLSKADSAAAVDAVIDTIAAELKNGGDVRLAGFATFGTRQRAASTGRNPRTGEAIQISASTVATFKAGKALKDTINS